MASGRKNTVGEEVGRGTLLQRGVVLCDWNGSGRWDREVITLQMRRVCSEGQLGRCVEVQEGRSDEGHGRQAVTTVVTAVHTASGRGDRRR